VDNLPKMDEKEPKKPATKAKKIALFCLFISSQVAR
jgi:hypothetical protein